jgi:hypothetical protein
MLGNVLQAKESQYQAGRKQLSDAYGKILYSPMTREDNIQKRDEFFKAIDQDIKKMAGLDLSLPQNQQAAMKVFNGYYDDKLIVKDMMSTKNFQGQQMKGELLKSCIDPEKCGGQWWEGGDKELLYKQDEFRKMSATDAMNFQDVEYTPFHNVETLALDFATKNKLSMKMDVKSGGWIVTNVNGQIMEPHLAEMFLSKFGNDPRIRKMYKTQGYLNRKDWVAGNMQLHNNDEAATNQAYIANMMALSEKAQEEKKKLDAKTDKSKNDKSLIEEQVKKNGYYQGVDGKLKSLYDAITQDVETLEGAQAVAKEETDNYQSAKTNIANQKYSLERIDEIVGINLLKAATGKAAHHYATLTAESSNLRANPFALNIQQSDLSLRNSLITADDAFKKSLMLKQIDFENDVQKEQIKKQIEDGTYDGTVKGKKVDDGGINADPNITGTGTNRGTVKPKDENYKMLFDAQDNVNTTKASFLQSFIGEVAKGYKNENAKKEERDFYKNALTATLKGTGISVDDVLKNNLTPAEAAKLSKLSQKQLNDAYVMASDYSNPDSQNGGPAKNFFSNTFFSATGIGRAKLQTEEKALAGVQEKMKGVAVNTANQVIADIQLTDKETGGKKAAILQEYLKLNTNARPFSKDEVMAEKRTGAAFRNLGLKYAENNWKMFIKEANPYVSPTTATAADIKKAKIIANTFYTANVESTMDKFNTHYNETAVSYKQAPGIPGKKGNAVAAMGYSGYADSDKKEESYDMLADWGNTYQKLINDPQVKVAFGTGAALATTTDKDAKKVLELMLFDMKSAHKKGDVDRFRTNWHAQMVSGGNENYVSFTIKPDAAYLKKYEGTQKKPGLLYGLSGLSALEKNAEDGITVFFPKNKVDNSFTALFEGNTLDYEYNATQELEMNSKYFKSKLIQNKTTRLPELHWTESYLNANGDLKTIDRVEYFSESQFGEGAKDFKASVLADQYLAYFFQKDAELDAAMQKVRNGKGTTDPNALKN